MSIPFCCSDAVAYALSTVRLVYPNVNTVYYCVALDGTPIEPAVTRVRSRDRHSPGSGNYFCSHIERHGSLSGYLHGTIFYATNLVADDYVRDPDHIYNTSFTHGVRREEVKYSYRWGTNHWSTSYSLTEFYGQRIDEEGRVHYHVLVWNGVVDGRQKYDRARALAMTSEPSSWDTYWNRRASLDASEKIGKPTFEDRHMKDSIDYGVFPSLGAYLNDVYLSAFESLPSIKTNNIQNLLAIKEFLGAIVGSVRNPGRLISGIGSASDAWLGYRYVYSTTKADIQELSSYVERMRALRDADNVRSYGFKSYEVNGEQYEFRCSITVKIDDYLGIYNTVERLGLALDGYNLWDMIPYSFMVDWFLHIGNLIEAGRNRRYAMRLTPSACWFSITHTFINGNGDNQCDYYRFAGDVHLSQLPVSMLSQNSAAGTTWLKRAADALAIFS